MVERLQCVSKKSYSKVVGKYRAWVWKKIKQKDSEKSIKSEFGERTVNHMTITIAQMVMGKYVT